MLLVCCLTGGVGVFVAFRLLGLTDRRASLFALATLTVWVLVPCVVALAVGAALRIRSLVVIDLVLLAALMVWVAPDLRWWSTGADVDGPISVVATANIFGSQPNFDATAAVLVEVQADVLSVVELTEPGRQALHAAGIGSRYPYRIEDARSDAFGSAIYSRYPLRDTGVMEVAGNPMAHATAELPSGPTTVIAVHTSQPLGGVGALDAQLAALGEVVKGMDGPVVLAGDFNATRQHQPFRELLEMGLTDAHMATGRGWAATWPVGRRVPPFALIDHVLVTHDLAVTESEELEVGGSDHLAVIATVGPSA